MIRKWNGGTNANDANQGSAGIQAIGGGDQTQPDGEAVLGGTDNQRPGAGEPPDGAAVT
jgi:hypothetical protein